MLEVKVPISKFIIYSYKETSIIKDISLREKLENLIDLLKIRTKEKGIEHTAKTLQNELIEIRIELIKYLIENPKMFDELQKIIIKEIAKKYNHQGSLKGLCLMMADVLDVNLKMLPELGNLIEKHSSDIINTAHNFSLEDLRNPLIMPPSRESQIMLAWLESSLNIELGLVAGDLVISNEIQISDKEIKTLIRFLKQMVTNYGAYSILINFWKPEIDDEDILIRNIKIKAAALELENGMGSLFSNDTIRELIHE